MLKTQKQIDFAHSTFSNLQELARMADSKANTTITLDGIFLGVFIAVIGTTGLEKILEALDTNDVLPLLFAIASLAFLVSAVISLIFCLFVIWPRERERVITVEGTDEADKADETQLMYYKDIIERYRSFSRYFEALSTLDEQMILRQISLQNYVMSSIVTQKMTHVKRIIQCYVFVFPSFLLAMGLLIGLNYYY